jgi:hypothetical protein
MTDHTTTERSMTDEQEIKNALQAFHDDEEGLEVLQVVLIIALAALIFFFIRFLWSNFVKPAAKSGVSKGVENLDKEGAP